MPFLPFSANVRVCVAFHMCSIDAAAMIDVSACMLTYVYGSLLTVPFWCVVWCGVMMGGWVRDGTCMAIIVCTVIRYIAYAHTLS